jgi:hypothetical protein
VPERDSHLSANVLIQNLIIATNDEGRGGNESTLPRLRMGWGLFFALWPQHFSELADYRKIHGHCNVPVRTSDNLKLGTSVATQRSEYRRHVKGKPSSMTLPRIEALESLDFEWNPKKGPSAGQKAQGLSKVN